MRTHPIEHYQALRDSVPCLSRATTPPEGHQIGARKGRTPGNTILSQPYRRRVSTDRLNRESSQLAASLEGEPGPTPAGKTLPHSYPEARFFAPTNQSCRNVSFFIDTTQHQLLTGTVQEILILGRGSILINRRFVARLFTIDSLQYKYILIPVRCSIHRLIVAMLFANTRLQYKRYGGTPKKRQIDSRWARLGAPSGGIVGQGASLEGCYLCDTALPPCCRAGSCASLLLPWWP